MQFYSLWKSNSQSKHKKLEIPIESPSMHNSSHYGSESCMVVNASLLNSTNTPTNLPHNELSLLDYLARSKKPTEVNKSATYVSGPAESARISHSLSLQ